MAVILFIEAAIVASDIFFYQTFGNTWMSLAAILFGMGAVLIFGQKNSADVVDFPHLSERAMLYVVFTFGEMIISITGYFEDRISLNTLYFSGMAFLFCSWNNHTDFLLCKRSYRRELVTYTYFTALPHKSNPESKLFLAISPSCAV